MGENWKTGLGDNWEVGDSSKDSQYSDGIFYRIKIWDYSHSESGRSMSENWITGMRRKLGGW